MKLGSSNIYTLRRCGRRSKEVARLRQRVIFHKKGITIIGLYEARNNRLY